MMRRLARYHRPGQQPNIAIWSSARSGSSWLMELIASQPGFVFVDEPLHPGNMLAADWIPGTDADAWQFLLPNPEREQVFRERFSAIESGSPTPGMPRIRSGFYRWRTNRIVYKLLRAKDLMPWFEDTFDWQTVYLLRHPLATAISRKVFPRLPLFLENEAYRTTYLDDRQLHLARAIVQDGSPVEQAVLDWVLQNLPALQQAETRNWLIVHYEDLVRHPAGVIARLAGGLDLPEPERMLRRVNAPSGSVVQSDATTRQAFRQATGPDTDFLLSRWREKLSAGDEQAAFRILDAFEIRRYQPGHDLPVSGSTETDRALPRRPEATG